MDALRISAFVVAGMTLAGVGYGIGSDPARGAALEAAPSAVVASPSASCISDSVAGADPLDGGSAPECAASPSAEGPDGAAEADGGSRGSVAAAEPDAAIPALAKAAERRPASSHAWNNLGLALLRAHRFEEAASALERAISLEPVEPYMWNNLGLAYERLGQIDDALDAYLYGATMGSKRAETNLKRLSPAPPAGSPVAAANVERVPAPPGRPESPRKPQEALAKGART
jgi:tetratricopeptide (TPR) repeat protein